ncbi:hypothetical protein HMI56_000767 [Coelomomyces lativittatus]|nr:hypothetical protein HMI56_000767 [Coelomomyces lativittatus]
MTFFKDLDKKSGKCGQITRSQFARLMSMVGISISESELYILLEKYRDPFHIDYLDFVRQVDPECISFTSFFILRHLSISLNALENLLLNTILSINILLKILR